MNVLMLLDHPFISDNRVEKEAVSLTKAGHHVTVLAEVEDDLEKNEQRNEFSIIRIFTGEYKKYFKQKYIKEVSKSILQLEFDVLHCHDYHMLQIGSYIKSVRPEKILIYDSHEYLRGWKIYKGSQSLLNRVKGYLVWKKEILNEKRAAKKADFIVTVTKPIANLLKKNFQLKEAPLVVHNFIDTTSNDKYDKNYLRNTFNIPNDKLIVAHIGNIYLELNKIDFFIKSICSSESIALVFIGNSKKFLNLKQHYKNNSSVYFHDYLNQPENIKTLSSSDVGIVKIDINDLSHLNGLTNRYVEYTIAGLAVVSNRQKGIMVLNENIQNVVFYEHDKDIPKAIDKVLEQKNELLTNAKNNAHLLSWKTEAEKLINLYKTLEKLKNE
ncbi:MAG: glycosyltransferase [Bacteroidales bacterium]|nr:glycosyltransferase [Bacteroidales bacterium]